MTNAQKQESPDCDGPDKRETAGDWQSGVMTSPPRLHGVWLELMTVVVIAIIRVN